MKNLVNPSVENKFDSLAGDCDNVTAFEIGVKVQWTVGGKTRKGLFMKQVGSRAEVMTTHVEGRPFVMPTILEVSQLSKA